jgi:hypothetical protein
MDAAFRSLAETFSHREGVWAQMQRSIPFVKTKRFSGIPSLNRAGMLILPLSSKVAGYSPLANVITLFPTLFHYIPLILIITGFFIPVKLIYQKKHYGQ